MRDPNELYQESLQAIDFLLDEKNFQLAEQTLDALYQFKPVHLAWFVRKARFLWLTDEEHGIERAQEVLSDKFVLNYCYDGIPEALALLAEMEGQRGSLLEQERLLCTLDLVQRFGMPDATYNLIQSEMEKDGQSFWASGLIRHAQALWRQSYISSDAITAIVAQHYLRQNAVEVPDLLWAAELPNIQYVYERLEETGGQFIVLAEDENRWQAAALAKMLAGLGKQVYLLLPPILFSESAEQFFDESGQACINHARNQNEVQVIDTYYIQQDDQIFDNRYLVIEQLIGTGGTLFTVLGSGCLMDDVALAGEMKKHFERFNLQMGDMLDTNFSAGWAGDYIKYLENIYAMDVGACLDAPTTCKYSIVLPARNSAKTLRYTLQTCLEQDFPPNEYEIIVSDNSTSGNTEIYQLCQELNDPRIRYIVPPRELIITKNFEFAFLHTRGEFILSLGSDDGLLPWALRVLDDTRKRYPDEPIIEWERGFYAWPGFNGEQENEFAILRDYKTLTQVIDYVDRKDYFRIVAQNPNNIYLLPLLYINSGFRRDYMKTLLEKTGRMWDASGQDIYMGIVNILINKSILNLHYPLSIAGMSEGSAGLVSSGLISDHSATKILNMLRRGNSISISTHSLPEKLSPPGSSNPSLLIRFVYRCVARGLISFEEVYEIFDLKNLFLEAAMSCNSFHDQSEQNLRKFLYASSLYGDEFLHWCEQHIFNPFIVPRPMEHPHIPKYEEGRNAAGGEILDASKYGVENVAQAVHLFVSRSGLMPAQAEAKES